MDSEIKAFALAKDGRRVLTGHADLTMRLWDLTNGNELRRFSGHTHEIVGVAFLPNGKQGLSAAEGLLRLWDLDTGQVLRTLEIGLVQGTNLAVNLQGDAVLTGAGEVHYWPLGAK
jgi:WD40 repeat protein